MDETREENGEGRGINEEGSEEAQAQAGAAGGSDISPSQDDVEVAPRTKAEAELVLDRAIVEVGTRYLTEELGRRKFPSFYISEEGD